MFPNIDRIIQNKLISFVDFVFNALMTWGKAHEAKQMAPKIPRQCKH